MSNLPDNPERDARINALWREHSTQLPSAALDAAILAAAHRAVDSQPMGSVPQDGDGNARNIATPVRAATRPQRWWMPLAAAATIGAIAIGVLQTVPQEQPDMAPAATITRPAPTLIPPQEMSAFVPAVPAPALPHAEADTAPPKTLGRLAATTHAAPQPFPAEKKNEAADAMTAQAPRAPAMDDARQRSTVAQDSPARDEVARGAPMASGAAVLAKSRASAESAPMKAVDVDATIMRIRKLHDDGKLGEAAKELLALRAVIPDADARLPPELRAWAATVKP